MRLLIAVLVSTSVSMLSAAPQVANKSPVGDPAVATRKAITLVENGRCKEALPLLKQSIPRLNDKQLKYSGGMAEARCAMALDEQAAAAEALFTLRREFPGDPEVLYISTHYFSQLAMRSSQELAAKAPNSYQARRLEAEALESQGKWDQVIGIYKGILKDNPQTAGIHYRLGQALLSKAGDSGPVDEAKAEFQKELQMDPHNAAAEFVLGELARRAGQWTEAAQHFSNATKLDVGFSEAYLALGMSLASAGKYAEAIPPLRTYVQMQPADAAGHYQLAIAYSRVGDKDGAARELALQKQASAHSQAAPQP
ncbi:MAG: tetratricopeptide repeat protein [Acidobacteriaceae bacterium]|nr:tetratricopeptide repeat protein [Acidobacteriaceae bacterium]MBV9781391.1 tetratricopeptide repeat protein [Acidobacteriaceae bacterium]